MEFLLWLSTGFIPVGAWLCGYFYGKAGGMSVLSGAMLFVTLASISACIFSLLAPRDTVAENAALRDRAERQSKRREARGGEPVLVEAAIPFECIGAVRCDFDGFYHVQVLGEEVVTDEETYRRVIEARDAHIRRMREMGVKVD